MQDMFERNVCVVAMIWAKSNQKALLAGWSLKAGDALHKGGGAMPPENITASEDGALKLSFVLTKEQAGPFPVSTETLWCRHEAGNYRVKNVPFFIDEISFDDLISVRALGNGNFEIESVIAPSQNSTIWLYFKNGVEESTLLDELLSVGCGVEGGVIDGYYAINVPKCVDIDLVYSLISDAESDGMITADYPSIRR